MAFLRFSFVQTIDKGTGTSDVQKDVLNTQEPERRRIAQAHNNSAGKKKIRTNEERARRSASSVDMSKEDDDISSLSCCTERREKEEHKEKDGKRKRLAYSPSHSNAKEDAKRGEKEVYRRFLTAWQAHYALKHAGRRSGGYRVPPELCYVFDSSEDEREKRERLENS